MLTVLGSVGATNFVVSGVRSVTSAIYPVCACVSSVAAVCGCVVSGAAVSGSVGASVAGSVSGTGSVSGKVIMIDFLVDSKALKQAYAMNFRYVKLYRQMITIFVLIILSQRIELFS